MNEKSVSESATGALRLDWSRLLGFDQVCQGAHTGEKVRKHARLAKVGSKVGAKTGLKPSLESVRS